VQAQQALGGATTTDPLQFSRIREQIQQDLNTAASQGTSHQMLQAVMAQQVCGAVANPMAVLPYNSTQQQQTQQQQWLLRSSSSSSTGTVQQTAHMQQGDRGGAESVSCMSAPPFAMQQERQGGAVTQLQALLETVLQDAGQLAARSTHTPAELQEQALQECCSEFLNATATWCTPAQSAPAAAYPAAGQHAHLSTLSRPCGAASTAAGRTSFEFSGPLPAPSTAARSSLDRSALPPVASTVARASFEASAAPPALSAVTRASFDTSASLPALSAAGRASFDASGSLPALSAATAAAAAARTSFEDSSTSCDDPCGQAGPTGGSIFLQTTGSLDAALYVSAVMRAVMDLHTALLHR
jgi:hypothetical protein